MEDFSIRLEKALQARHMTAAELSRSIGVGEGTISCYRSGKYKPKQVRLEEIAKALNVSIAYLFGADVNLEPYYPETQTNKKDDFNTYTLDAVEREIIDTYRKADGKQKLRVGSLIQDIAEEIEKNSSASHGDSEVC